MAWTFQEQHFADMMDAELVRAYLSCQDTYRRSRGRDQTDDYGMLLLIRDVARQQGRERVLDEAVERQRASQGEATMRTSE